MQVKKGSYHICTLIKIHNQLLEVGMRVEDCSAQQKGFEAGRMICSVGLEEISDEDEWIYKGRKEI